MKTSNVWVRGVVAAWMVSLALVTGCSGADDEGTQEQRDAVLTQEKREQPSSSAVGAAGGGESTGNPAPRRSDETRSQGPKGPLPQ